MGIRLIIEGNAAYEIDEDCMACQNRSKEKGVVKGTEKRETRGRKVRGTGKRDNRLLPETAEGCGGGAEDNFRGRE